MKQDMATAISPRESHPYSAMLESYQAALVGCRARLAELRRFARALDMQGSASQAERYLLEKRILTLRDECSELSRDIKDIQFYAERECAYEQKKMEPGGGQSAGV